MRFLIVDDNPKQTALLRDELIKNGIQDNDVVTTRNASEARRALAAGSFDAMLLDVLLPGREGENPSGTTSVELLRQIIDDGVSTSPKYIFGITSSLDALKTFEDEFRRMTLQVYRVSEDDPTWKDYIRNGVAFIRRVRELGAAYDYDVCVLNALRTPELKAIQSNWPVRFGEEQLLSRNVLYRSGEARLGSRQLRIVCAHPALSGPVATAQATEVLLNAFRPRLLLMTGICGGFSEHVALGDVIAAEKSWDWQAGKWTEEGILLSSSDHRDPCPELLAYARSTEPSLSRFHDEFDGTKPKAAPRLVVGPMVTGSSVVASSDIQQVFRVQHRKMVGVDMECYGLYYAAAAGTPTPRTLCLKSVSDLADRAKDDHLQAYCSYISARVGWGVVEAYFKGR